MTVLLAVLALIVVAALVLAVELLRPEPVSEQGLADLNQALTPGRDYEQMVRLFEDRDYRPAEKPLEAGQGPLMREYLKKLRGDFITAWAVCRLLAPISQEPDPAPKLFRRWLSFHRLFAVIWVKTYAGRSSQAVVQVQALLGAFRDLRQRAAALMQVDAGLSANASRTTRIRI